MSTATGLKYGLRPYQETSLNKSCAAFFGKKIYRQLLVLATGLGKTVCFATLPQFGDMQRWLQTYPVQKQKILVLAHRDELIKQAADKISDINPGLIVEIEKANQKASPFSDVIVASVQTLRGKRLQKLDPDDVRIVIVDEAHHATSPSYTKIFQHFGLLPPDAFGGDKPETGKADDVLRWQRARLDAWDQYHGDDKLLLGVTATPRRSDNVGLEAVFQDVVFSMGIREGIEAGYLSRIRAKRVLSSTSLDSVGTVAGDFNQGDLEEAVNTDDRNKLAVKAWLEHATGRKTIAFCASVAHAEDLANEFRLAGIPALAASGKLNDTDRKEVLRKFRASEIQVLTNCQLYTEGFDEPSVDCILHTKPTKSSIQYIQMTGRGTRLWPGKEYCLVIDVVDVTRRHSLLTASDLFGLPAGFDGKGEDLLNVAKKIDKAKEANPQLQTHDLRSLDELDMRVQEIDIWTAAITSEVSNGMLSWVKDGDLYRLPLARADKREQVQIFQDALGQWRVQVHSDSEAVSIASSPKIEDAFRSAENWVAINRQADAKLSNKQASWRADPPSASQTEFARKLKVPEHVIQSAKTKGDMANLINLAKSRAPKPKFTL
jgi:superfamily II DNA or RNA helicase